MLYGIGYLLILFYICIFSGYLLRFCMVLFIKYTRWLIYILMLIDIYDLFWNKS
jgi:hypothetical protein